MEWIYSDGGRQEAGYKGDAGDCVVRAIAIATRKPYKEVYNDLNAAAKNEKLKKGMNSPSSSRNGVYRETYEAYLKTLGYKWVPTMVFGKGCQVHLKASELPAGNIVVAVSKHLCAVIDGVVYDTHDPSRDETRCVYGYYIKEEVK